MADEPFLEQVLDDRSERVRKAAAGLLACLPESRLSQRMLARLSPLLRWTPGVGPQLPGGGKIKKPALEVLLPEEYEPTMQRDGIVRKPLSSSMGERAWWLNQMLELVPPAVRGAAWRASPSEILAAKLPKEWRGLLLASWAEAARRHADQPWLEALVEQARAGESALSLADLLPALPVAKRAALVLDLLTSGGPLLGDSPAMTALNALPGIWGHHLARAVLAALHQRLQDDNKSLRSDWHLRSAMATFAERIPADMASETSSLITDAMREIPYWGSAISEFEELLHFRAEMLGALYTA